MAPLILLVIACHQQLENTFQTELYKNRSAPKLSRRQLRWRSWPLSYISLSSTEFDWRTLLLLTKMSILLISTFLFANFQGLLYQCNQSKRLLSEIVTNVHVYSNKYALLSLQITISRRYYRQILPYVCNQHMFHP